MGGDDLLDLHDPDLVTHELDLYRLADVSPWHGVAVGAEGDHAVSCDLPDEGGLQTVRRHGLSIDEMVIGERLNGTASGGSVDASSATSRILLSISRLRVSEVNEMGQFLSSSTLQENIQPMRAWEAFHICLMRYAQRSDIENGRQVRIDSTAVESAVHDSTDASFLWDVSGSSRYLWNSIFAYNL